MSKRKHIVGVSSGPKPFETELRNIVMKEHDAVVRRALSHTLSNVKRCVGLSDAGVWLVVCDTVQKQIMLLFPAGPLRDAASP